MARLPKKICSQPGCGVLVEDGGSRCPQHEAERRLQADQRRPTAHKRGYNYRWQKARAEFLRKNHWCARCAQEWRLIPAEVVDHIIPHKGDAGLFWDRNNWMALCQRCHQQKTAREDGGFGNKIR